MGSQVQTESARLLEVRALEVRYRARDGRAIEAVRGVDLDLAAGEAVGLLGESGSGKSTLGLAVVGLLPPNGSRIAGTVELEGCRLDRLGEAELDRIRGARVAMVFQQPGLALSPFLRVGTQISDVLRAHRPVSAAAARGRALELLRRVRIEEPESVYRAYPHQLSGGQRQRVVIAQALICEPALLIADEPTAALDTVTQAALVELLRSLRAELGMALLFISHDPALLARTCDRIAVMYAGRIVEEAPAGELLAAPAHPYPRELLRCLPAPPLEAARGRTRLHVIPGRPPGLAPPPPGCALEARCPDRLERCAVDDPHPSRPGDRRLVACWNPTEVA